jgi:hypothetical protein
VARGGCGGAGRSRRAASVRRAGSACASAVASTGRWCRSRRVLLVGRPAAGRDGAWGGAAGPLRGSGPPRRCGEVRVGRRLRDGPTEAQALDRRPVGGCGSCARRAPGGSRRVKGRGRRPEVARPGTRRGPWRGSWCVSSLVAARLAVQRGHPIGGRPSPDTERARAPRGSTSMAQTDHPRRSAATAARVPRVVRASTVGPAPLTTAGTPRLRSSSTRDAVAGHGRGAVAWCRRSSVAQQQRRGPASARAAAAPLARR